MTCSLNTIAIIDDLPRIRTILVPHLRDSMSDDNDYSTTEADATDEEDPQTSEAAARTAALLDTYGKKKKKSSNDRYQWLCECQMSFSPTLNLLAVAFDQKIVISTAKNKPSSNEIIYLTTSFTPTLEVESNERITSVLCLPIASPTKRSTIEWTCVIVGFTTGYVRMYTEDGILLFSQLFHDKSVAQIKCHTQFPSSIRGIIEQPDELFIQYQSSILVVIDGLSLYQLLKVCREHAIKTSGSQSTGVTPQLAFKKWGLADQEQILDFVPTGLITDNRFDQFCVASMKGGYQAQIRSVAPLFTRLITVGADPYCNFYFCAEGAQTPHLTEVAYALADKVKSSFMSAMSRWIPSKQNPTHGETRKPKIEPETRTGNRFAIRDLRRHGEKVIVSPGLHIAAVSDSFGRILIYDVQRGIAIRMFKGYREAEIGFVQIEEPSNRDSSSRKSALFLIIHAPKRQLVEIWGCQQGARVAAFNVSKNSRLINLEHYTLGWANSGTHSSKISQYKQCVLMDENGEIKSFEIPFHLILSDRNNQRAHDILIVRQVRRIFKETRNDNEQLRNELRQQFHRLLSLESHNEIFDLLFHTDYLQLDTIEMFLNEIFNDLEKPSRHQNPQDILHLQEFCQNSLNLLKLYRTIDEIRKENLSSSTNDENDEIDLSSIGLDEDEAKIFSRLVENERKDQKRKVRFLDERRFTFGQFQSTFVSRTSSSTENHLEIKSTINSDEFSRLGSFIFASWFRLDENKFDEENFRSFLTSIQLKNDDLVLLCFHALLSMSIHQMKNVQLWKKLLTIVSSICSKKNFIRTTLEKTTNVVVALILAAILPEDFSLLKRQLSALVAVKQFLSTIKSSNDNENESSTIEFNVETIFLKHRSDFLLNFISERIVRTSIPPNFFTSDGKDTDFAQSLAILRQILPHTFESTVLFIYISWMSVQLWDKQLNSTENRTANEFLRISLLFYNQIQIGIIKENLGTMIWHRFFRDRIVALTKLIEKIGKIPKDRLCYKELRLTEKDLISFLDELRTKFFNTYIEAIYNHLSEVPIFNVDDVWRCDSSPNDSIDPPEPISPYINLYTPISTTDENEIQNSLLEKVMNEKSANGHLVLHHEKFISILFYLMKFQMKSIRPYELFDTKGIHAFFTDLHSHPLVTDDVDGSIGNKRQLFFTRLLNIFFEDHQRTKPLNEKFFDEILRLSTEMFVDHEYLRRHYIALLYAYNYDHLAMNEENRIHDRQSLALQLLTIAGLRLNRLIEGNVDSTTKKLSMKSLEIRAKMSSTLKTWFASLPTLVDYPVEDCSLESIETMLTRIGYYLPQTNLSQSNLAEEMVELVHLLKR